MVELGAAQSEQGMSLVAKCTATRCATGAHTFPAALDKETIGHFHDVGLVHCCDLVPSVVTGILEGILRHPSTGHSCDDLHNHRVTFTLWFVTQGGLSQIVKADLQ